MWDFAGNYLGQVTGFVISIFLARLLTPEDFGLVGMSMVLITVLKAFMDFGFAAALVQNSSNTSVTYSSVFFVNVFAGAVLTVLMYLASPVIGAFYNNGKVTTLVQLLSITFFLSSFNIVQSTILRKNLNFKYLVYRDLTGQVISGIIAVVLAWQGFGVYALIIQQIIASIIKSILLWRVAEWYPKFEFSWQEVKKLTKFSSYVFATQSINQIVRQADTLAVGKLFSPATLGLFSRAESLNDLINKNSTSTLSKVFFPALTMIKDDDERFNRVFLRLIGMIAAVSFFLTGFLYLTGAELIITLFGRKWEAAVPIFQIIIIKGFTYPISAMIINAFLAKGKSKENFYYGNIKRVIQLSPLLIAYFYGFYPFLYAFVVASVLGWLLNNYFASITLQIPLWSQIKVVLPCMCIAVVLIAVVELVIPSTSGIWPAILRGGIFAVGYLTALWLTKNPLVMELKQYYLMARIRFNLKP